MKNETMKTGNQGSVVEFLMTYLWLNSVADLPFLHEVCCNRTEYDLNPHDSQLYTRRKGIGQASETNQYSELLKLQEFHRSA